jgi:hypothetical protein
MPTHQFHINVKVNKVIDTTERRVKDTFHFYLFKFRFFQLFCSTFCYKASKYFERQIPKSPVWAREQQINSSFKVDLLTPETLK